MKNGSIKKLSMPLLAMTLPLFPLEIFIGFIFLNVMNKINQTPAFVPIGPNFG